MYSQAFSPKSLYSCTKQAERRNSGLKKDAFIDAISKELRDFIVGNKYHFQIKKECDMYINARKKKDFGYLCQNLILRKLHNNIKVIYKVKQADRNTIIAQMKELLNENVEIWVVRLDVKHFYESINRDSLLEKMNEDSRLSFSSMSLLYEIFRNPIVSSGTGLPRGLGISAAMSELYMKGFDNTIKRIDGVYYYARFVDDIIVFCCSERSKDLVWDIAKAELDNLGLELNKEKSYNWHSKEKKEKITYLGYSFSKPNEQVEVTIAENKIKAIKTRLTRSFVRYAKDHDFDMLKQRIKFLTGNFTLHQEHTLLPIKVGIFFNYKHATDIKCLDVLDEYYQRLLHCKKGKLGTRMKLDKTELKYLEKFSFRFGYEKRVNHHFTNDQMDMITRCW